jgi:hypothetical protein
MKRKGKEERLGRMAAVDGVVERQNARERKKEER